MLLFDKFVWLLIVVILIVTFIISLVIGSYDIEPIELVKFFVHKFVPEFFPGSWPELYETIVFNIRLPRLLLAMLVGASLSVAGVIFQGLFKNQLVSPYTLGLSGGAGFGAALAMAFYPGYFNIPLSSFLFGLLAVSVTYFLAHKSGETPVVSLVLAGVVVSALSTALLSIIQYLVNPLKLQGIIFWLMGGLNLASWKDVATAGPLIMFSLLLSFLAGWRLNVLSMGDSEARSLGIAVETNKIMLVFLATLSVSAAVSVSGVIGWVGLMIPHIMRLIMGPDHVKLLPMSALGGALFLLVADDFARNLLSFELPVGIVTTLLGAPFFAYLLKSKNRGGWI